MEGLCDICGRAAVLHTCSLCGKRVCPACYVSAKGVCVRCLSGRQAEK